MTKQKKRVAIGTLLVIIPIVLLALWTLSLEPYSTGFDADYVGSKVRTICHSEETAQWSENHVQDWYGTKPLDETQDTRLSLQSAH